MQTTGDKAGIGWGEVVALVLLAAVLVLVGFTERRPDFSPIPVGTLLPMLTTAGWLNSEETVTRESLLGQIVVVDFWETTCGPCLAAMPELAKLHAKYAPLGIRFIGLTPEPAGALAAVEKVVDRTPGFEWPVGYDSGLVFDMLSIQGVPTVVVFGPQGTAVWSGYSLHGIEEVLDQQLALME